MVQPSILMCWSFVQILMFCDLGENVTTGFSTLGDSIYFCDWYNFPLEIQRTLPTLLMVAEKSVELRGFGNIPCTRKAFRKVCFLFILKQCPTICGYFIKFIDDFARFLGTQSRIFVFYGASDNWIKFKSVLEFCVSIDEYAFKSWIIQNIVCLLFRFTLCMCSISELFAPIKLCLELCLKWNYFPYVNTWRQFSKQFVLVVAHIAHLFSIFCFQNKLSNCNFAFAYISIIHSVWKYGANLRE